MSACPSCAASLAPAQRYCVACGERCAPLPESVVSLLGIAPAVDADPAGAVGPQPRRAAPLAPSAAAVAVMAILGFGVIVGSVVSPPAESAPAPTLVAVSQPPAPPAAPVVEAPAAPATPAAAPPAAAAPAQQTVTQTTPAPPPPAPAPLPPIPSGPQLPAVKHVFLIVLSGHGYDKAFGPSSQAPYLASTLTKKGELLTNYYGVTGGSLANEIALISGQGPNQDTAADCPTYTELTPGTPSADPQQKGQLTGTGCVYPRAALTLPDELVANGNTWKAYVEDMGNAPAGQPTTCRHPAAGSSDEDHDPRPGDAYVTWRDPFAYFHSITDLGSCAETVVGLDRLDADLTSTTAAPSFSYIVPNRCHDGAQDPCTAGQASGLPAADAFLETLVPRIMGSPAYKDGGLIAITFDEAPQTGPDTDASACCAEPAYPNLPATPPVAPTDGTNTAPASTAPATTTPAATAPLPPGADSATGGGGRVGLLLISQFVKPGSTNSVSAYNHFSLLRSIEDLFGLQPTGYAGYPGVLSFDSVIYNAPAAKGKAR